MSWRDRASDITTVFVEVGTVVLDVVLLVLKVLVAVVQGCVKGLIPKKKKDLRGEVVLITGAGQGMGREVALKVAKMGATVVLWDINESNIKYVCDKIKKDGGKAHCYTCDVTSENEVNFKAKIVEKEAGEVSLLINNAGIMQNVPMTQLDSNKIRQTFNVNLLAHFWTIRAFLPNMEKNNKGHIVAIASGAGLIGHINQTDYSASKFGVVGMMEAFSEELRLKKSDIRLTTICPLTVNTGMNWNPSSRYSFLMPVLSLNDASDEIINAIQREDFLVMIPRRMKFTLSLARLFPREVLLEYMDFTEYCRNPNVERNIPKILENGTKVL